MDPGFTNRWFILFPSVFNYSTFLLTSSHKMSWPAWFTGPGRWQVVFSSSFVGTFSPLSSQNASVISTFSSCIPMTPTRALGDVLLLPFYVASASALLLAFYAVASSYPFRILRARIVPTSKGQTTSIHCDSENGGSHIDRPLIAALGGPVIYAFKLARFIGCVAFSGLSFVTLYVDRPCASQHPDWPQLAVCTTAVSMDLALLLPFLSTLVDIHVSPCAPLDHHQSRV